MTAAADWRARPPAPCDWCGRDTRARDGRGDPCCAVCARPDTELERAAAAQPAPSWPCAHCGRATAHDWRDDRGRTCCGACSWRGHASE